MHRSVLLMTLMSVPAAAADRPNILWLIAEDMGPELSCYGTPGVSTPRLDALAAGGVRYANAFTVTPVCSTSRSSFMTGMYAFTIGAHNHRSHRDDGFALPEGVRVLTDWLRPAGYFTGNLRRLGGKDPFFRGTGKTDWNFDYPGGQDAAFDTDRFGQLKSHQPFYAQVNFSETHRGGSWNKAHENIRPEYKPADPAVVGPPPYYPEHEITRRVWAQYLNAVMAVDKKAGHVLDLLARDGLAENTVVFFMGDHGRAMPRGKQFPYDSGLRVPLIVHVPPQLAWDGWEPGTTSDRLVESIDWTATTLALAGVPVPPKMQGEVFLGPDAAAPPRYAFGGRDRGDETADRVRTVRDGRFRYLRNFHPERPLFQTNRYKEATYPILRLMRTLHARGELPPAAEALMAETRPAEELYDVQADPYEIRNLADDPAYAADLARLRGALDEWLVRIDDQGRFPEPQAVVEKWLVKAQRTYDRRIEKLPPIPVLPY